MNHITDQFYGLVKGKEGNFAKGFGNIFRSILNSHIGVYCSDNLFVWERNLSFMKNKKLMESFNKNSNGKFPLEGILWRTATIAWAAENALNIEGDFVECGCYKGTTAKVIYDYLNFSKIKDKNYYLYDIFEYDDNFSHHKMPEHSKTLYSEVKKLFKEANNVKVIKGKLPDSFTEGCPQKISLLHLDLNNLDAEIDTLEILFEKMVKGSILILDDFGWLGYENQCKHETEWFKERGYSVLEMPTGQGIVIKR